MMDEKKRIAALNEEICTTLNRPALARLIDERVPGLSTSMESNQPHVFSESVVFVAREDITRMHDLIAAVESVIALPAYRDAALRSRGRSLTPGARGAFISYDFHLTPDGPQLIEINTNAGGGMLSALQQQAEVLAPLGLEGYTMGEVPAEEIEDRLVDMLVAEWHLSGQNGTPAHVAIVDDAPQGQYLYPEFALIASAITRRGMPVLIADPREFMICHGGLWHEETPIDLVYNRLTDFELSESAHTAVQEAYRHQYAVVTPHPQAHALYADKRNLVRLSDEQWLRDAGVPPTTIAMLLACIPETQPVTPQSADGFWATRKRWFFKPAAGFGSRAAYRGDKITKRAFEQVAAGYYVAQAFAPAPERRVATGDTSVMLKYDVRIFVYKGELLLTQARLYQGQTTNFRTPGGGLAPVLYRTA